MSSSSTTSSTNAAERSGASADTSRPAQFAPTHWSVVLAAADGDSPKAAAALAQLCRDYWYPLYAFVRRKGFSPPEAQDLTQDFFARLLEKDLIKAADPARGKFRSFLSASMQNFLNNEWARRRTEKRGGKAAFLSLDDSTAEDRYQLEAVSDVTPE
ncbi:MAG TPA: sigma factor, partial [Candidatus Eisenbacteria bacterium]|nr:sigma factor [Candidatus Eisenbacteria bacterium]